MARVSQKQRVLTHLQDHRKINPMGAIRDYGVYRLAAVIYSLKNEGHLISTEMVNSTNRYGDTTAYAVYHYSNVKQGGASSAADYAKAKNGD